MPLNKQVKTDLRRGQWKQHQTTQKKNAKDAVKTKKSTGLSLQPFENTSLLSTQGAGQRFGWVSKCCGVLHDRSGTCFLLSGMKSMPTAESLLYICRLQTRSLLCCVCLSYAIREALWSLLKLKSKVWTCWHVRDVGRDIWKWGRDKWKEKRRKRWGWIEDQNQTSFMKESLSSCSAASLIRFSE